MKLIKTTLIYLGIAGCLFLVSCAKTRPEQIAQVDNDVSNKATVQLAIAMVNATRNYVYVDGVPVTGLTLGTGSIFPTAATAIGFTVNGGLRNFVVRDTLPPAGGQIPYGFAENMQVGKHYTVFLYDTITAPKQKTVLDDVVIPADTTARIRVANFPYTTAALPNIDVYSFFKKANIFTNVAITDVTPFIAYPSRLPTDTLYVRETGTQNLIFKTVMTFLTPKRNYTFLIRGSGKALNGRLSTVYATY